MDDIYSSDSNIRDNKTDIKMSEREVTIEVKFEGSMTKAINKAAKLLYSQEREDEYGAKMLSERKGDNVISTMTFRKR